MIVPMKKVSLVVMEKEREASLEKLRKIGVVHLEKKNISSDALIKLLDQKSRAEAALRTLQPYVKIAEASVKKTKGAVKYPGPDDAVPVNAADRHNFVTRILDYADEQKRFQDRLIWLRKERSRIEEWGNFNPGDISYLAEKVKLNLFLYKLPRKVFDSLMGSAAGVRQDQGSPAEEIRYITLSEDKKFLHLIVFDRELSGRVPFAVSEYSLEEIDSLISDICHKLTEIEKQLGILAKDKNLAEEESKALLAEIEFETARAGMDILESVPRDSAVAWITGFVPSEDMGLLRKGAAENGWALAADDPGSEDNVPTKLKNNRLVMLLNPLTDFLDILPGYREVDVSGWFLLFFTLFFGMIFSDAAYGALLIIIAIVLIMRNLKKGVHSGLKLLLLLGCSNFIWGVLTCTWLGLEPGQIPVMLQQISLPQISNVTAAKSAYGEGIVRQNLMIFCFTLALLHLSIGHIIAIRQNRTLKILADIGAIAMLIGMYGFILSLIASNEYRKIPLFMPCLYLLAVGFILNTAFVNYEGSIGKSVLASLKNFISVILGVSNVFSDIMSYLRLWAVGLAGSAIASIVVALAGPMLGHFFFFIFGVILLVSGHGINLILNTLSVLVHGVRLNTLEFSGRVGLNWSGFAYRPFSVRKNPRV